MNSTFLIDVRRGDDCRRVVTDEIPLILKMLGRDNLGTDLEYLRIERVPKLVDAVCPGVKP